MVLCVWTIWHYKRSGLNDPKPPLTTERMTINMSLQGTAADLMEMDRQEKLRLAQIDSLKTLNTGDIFLYKGSVKIVVHNNNRDGHFAIKDIGPQSLPTDDWNYSLLWHYQPNFWIARWNTPKWHQLMADAWKPEQPNH